MVFVSKQNDVSTQTVPKISTFCSISTPSNRMFNTTGRYFKGVSCLRFNFTNNSKQNGIEVETDMLHINDPRFTRSCSFNYKLNWYGDLSKFCILKTLGSMRNITFLPVSFQFGYDISLAPELWTRFYASRHLRAWKDISQIQITESPFSSEPFGYLEIKEESAVVAKSLARMVNFGLWTMLLSVFLCMQGFGILFALIMSNKYSGRNSCVHC